MGMIKSTSLDMGADGFGAGGQRRAESVLFRGMRGVVCGRGDDGEQEEERDYQVCRVERAW